jgi:hypothetical protein
MTPPALDPLTMGRLALIRLLYLQGLEQSRLPQPVVYSSVLTFHDTVELFLGLTADRLSANLPANLPFMKYWDELHPNKLGNRGVDLSGRGGMDRLNRLRNGFKHAGTLPGLPAIEQARAEVTSFLEDSTPKVFGISFGDIDMADVVPQQDIRDKLKAAAAKNSSGDRIEAMALLVEAFNEVFGTRVRPGPFRGTPFSFGQDIRFPLDETSIRRIFSKIDQHGALGSSALARQLHQVTQATQAIQAGIRVLALGIDYAKYQRFQTITPHVSMTLDGKSHRTYAPTYAPRSEDFDSCYQFVITVALRAAEVEAHSQDMPPSSRAGGV